MFGICKFASAGCGNQLRAKIVGTWEIEQADKLTNRLKLQDEEQEPTGGEPSPSRMSIQFARSGQLTTTTLIGDINRSKKGTWSLVSFDEESQTAKVDCQIGLQQTEHEIKLIDDDTIEMTPPNMAGLQMKLRFKRSR